MRKLLVLPCLALLIAAAPSTTEPSAVANQIAPSDGQQAVALSGGRTAQTAEEKKICKQLPSSSSRLPKRACLTEKEWQQVDQDLAH
ncbi:MAG: hypothetical protein ACJ8FS_13000 [Sphingomicrobium sp.]